MLLEGFYLYVAYRPGFFGINFRFLICPVKDGPKKSITSSSKTHCHSDHISMIAFQIPTYPFLFYFIP